VIASPTPQTVLLSLYDREQNSTCQTFFNFII